MPGKGCIKHSIDPCRLNVCVGCGILFLKDDFRYTSFCPYENPRIYYACEACIKSGRRKWTPVSAAALPRLQM